MKSPGTTAPARAPCAMGYTSSFIALAEDCRATTGEAPSEHHLLLSLLAGGDWVWQRSASATWTRTWPAG